MVAAGPKVEEDTVEIGPRAADTAGDAKAAETTEAAATGTETETPMKRVKKNAAKDGSALTSTRSTLRPADRLKLLTSFVVV